MAERRMFSKRITSSARFLKMPVSTQALYFHLGLHADDDGIVEAYTVMNSIGATEDDLKILVAKEFVQVLNEDLVTYILDWKENNKIRADRKVDSIYKNLLLQVNPDVRLIESRKRTDNELRSKMCKESKLPDKFNAVMRELFYGEHCPICNVTMQDGNTKASIQHNTPISQGGIHEIGNISVICLSCNMALKNKATGALNNDLVRTKWTNYIESEDSLRTDKGQHRLGKDRLGKDRLGKDRLGKDRLYIKSGASTPILAETCNNSCKDFTQEIKTDKSVKSGVSKIEPPDLSLIDLPTNKYNTQNEIFYVTSKFYDSMVEIYPNVDVMDELRKMKGWLLTNPEKRKTRRGMSKFINNWLSRTQDQNKNSSTYQQRQDYSFQKSKKSNSNIFLEMAVEEDKNID